MNALRYFIIFVRKKIKQISSVSYAIATSKISAFPESLANFEKNYASYSEQDYALSFCNGTSAIEAAMFAIGIQPGDEVIAASLTFHASFDPACNLGAKIVFADVDERNFTICPDDVERKITDKTRAIVVTHLFGIPADMQRIREIADRFKVDIVEDTSHSHGGIAAGKKCGTLGRIGAYSLQGAKAIAAGEGGICVTNNREDYIRMSLWGHFTRDEKLFAEIGCEEFAETGFGYKRRMAPLSACMAQADLDEIDRSNDIMNETADLLDQALDPISGIMIPKLPKNSRRGGFFCGYPFRVDGKRVEAEKIVSALRSIGIKTSTTPFPLHHKMAIYNDLEYRRSLFLTRKHRPLREPSDFPDVILKNTEELEKDLILLPRRYLVLLSKSKISKIADIIRKAVDESKR